MNIRVTLQLKRVLHVTLCVLVASLTVLGTVRTTAGIQGSGIRAFAAIGVVTGIGAGIVVDGVEYSTSRAQFELDGHPGHQSQLRAGDIVQVVGTISGHGPFTADQVTFSGNVQGAVAGIDIPGRAFFVLGQTVHVNSDALFDPSIQPAALEGLHTGEVVEVSGFRTSAGELLAARIDARSHSPTARVAGSVEDLELAQKTFRINSLLIDFASAEVGGTLANGASVTVEGTEPDAGGTLRANAVNVANALQVEPGTDGRIEGLITDLASSSYFEVNGQPVAVNAQTHVKLRVPLGLDVAVKVTGVFDETGALVARKLETEASHAK